MEHLPKKTHENGITYTLVGDYYIPDLQLQEENRPIGRWGRLHREYLKQVNPMLFNDLILTGNLWTYLVDLNEQAQERLERIIEQFKTVEGITEEMKARDQLAWVGAMNSIRNRAEEIVCRENRKEGYEMVLDELYYGNIYPSEQILVHDKEYHKLRKHTGVLPTQLEEKLTSGQMKLVNQFHSHLIDVNGLEAKASFQYGFSLGLILMKEAQELLRQENL